MSTAPRSPILLQLGCGTNRLPSPWVNYDYDMDITKPLPFPDNSVRIVFIEHCLEHVSGPDGFRFMKEAYRILEPQGEFRICVPELIRLPVAKKADIIENHGHLMVYCYETLSQMLIAAGFHEDNIRKTGRMKCDGHWRVIGEEADELETLRVEAVKFI